MENGQDFHVFLHHLKILSTDLSAIFNRNKWKGIIVLFLLTLQVFCLVVFVQSINRVTRDLKVMSTSTKSFSPSDLPVFTFCSKEQYRQVMNHYCDLFLTISSFREEKLKMYGIQSSMSYAMDTDWVGHGTEDLGRIFEESVLKLEDIVRDIKFYLDNSTPEGDTIVRNGLKINLLYS